MEQQAQPQERRRKVLVIEDDKDTNLLFSDNLRGEDYEVFSVFDGEEGLKVAMEWRPDLILMDLLLPRIDGWEVCRRLREPSSPLIRTPIIIVSILAKDTMGSKRSMGPITIFNKPFEVKSLLSSVQQNLEHAPD